MAVAAGSNRSVGPPSQERPVLSASSVPTHNPASDSNHTNTCAQSRQPPGALRQLSFAGAGPVNAGAEGEQEGMTGVEWEALLQDADRLLSAPLEPPASALGAKARTGNKAQTRKTAQPDRSSARPASAPSHMQHNTKPRFGSTVANRSGGVDGILGTRSSAEVREFMEKRKKEREKQEREEREEQEMQRRKQLANLDKYKRFPVEQARVIQAEARHKIASRIASQDSARHEPVATIGGAGRCKLPTDKKHSISSAYDIVRVPPV